MTERFDVLVIGSGPAGCATSIELLQSGYTVGLVERETLMLPRRADTLSPSALPLLCALGVEDVLAETRAMAVSGVSSLWGTPEPVYADALYGALGAGWHIERTTFDAWLRVRALALGATVLRGLTLRPPERRADGRWRMLGIGSGGEVRIEAAWLVDASGRSAWLARSCGARRRRLDLSVALVSYGCQVGGGDDRCLALEATSDGWWYAVPMRDRRSMVAYVTDADLLPRSDLAQWWHGMLRATKSIGPRVAPSEPIRSVSADMNALHPVGGDGWFAVGDAQKTVDPLSGLGLTRAFASARRVCAAIREGHPAAELTQLALAELASDLESRRSYTATLTSFTGQRFWQRRATTLATAYLSS